MVRVRVATSPDGTLSALAMSGHVSSEYGPRGANAACAAVTGLVRSCVAAIVGAKDIEAFGSADSEGELEIEVLSVPDHRTQWLRGVTDVLLSGLERISGETPGEVSVTVERSGDTDPGRDGR